MTTAEFYVAELKPDSAQQRKNHTFFDGYMTSDTGVYMSRGPKPPRIAIEEAREATGEFLLVECSQDKDGNKQYEILTDVFGFYSAFYSVVDGSLFLSNSFKALKKHLDKIHSPTTFNPEFVAPLIISSYRMFGYPHAHQTAAREIRIVPSTHAIKFSAKGLEFVEKIPASPQGNYDELLEEGLRRAKKRFESVNNHFQGSFKKLFMSGGRDSRATLALMLSVAGNRDFFVHNSNPLTTTPAKAQQLVKDQRIANKIALLLGLQYCKKDPLLPIEKTTSSFDQSLGNWQNSFSNLRFNFQPSFYRNSYSGKQLNVQFRGAGGEIFRAYWADVLRRYENTYKKIRNTKTSVLADAGYVFNAFVSGKVISPEIFHQAREIFSGAVNEMAGETFLQKVDQHYSFYRHRFHFAHGNKGLSVGEFTYLPLMDKHLFLASRKLTDAEKLSGKMVFDIVDRLHPYLNLIEYDSTNWPETTIAGSKHLKAARYIDLPDFDEVSTHKPRSLTREFSYSQDSDDLKEFTVQTYDRAGLLKARLVENIEFLRSHGSARELFTDELIALLNKRVDANQSINALVGKTQSARDALETTVIEYKPIKL